MSEELSLFLNDPSTHAGMQTPGFGPRSPFCGIPYTTTGPAANREEGISLQISDPTFRNKHQVLFLCQAAPEQKQLSCYSHLWISYYETRYRFL